MRVYDGVVKDPIDFRVPDLDEFLHENGFSQFSMHRTDKGDVTTVDRRNVYEVENIIKKSANVLDAERLYSTDRPVAPQEFLSWVGTRLQLLNELLAEHGLPYFATTLVSKSRVKSVLSLVGIEGSPLYIGSERILLSAILGIDNGHISFLRKASAATLSNLGYQGKPLIKAQCEYVRKMSADTVRIPKKVAAGLLSRFRDLLNLRSSMLTPDLLLSPVLYTLTYKSVDCGWYSADIHPTVCSVSDFDLIVSLRHVVSTFPSASATSLIRTALETVPTPISMNCNGVMVGFTAHGFQSPDELYIPGERRDCRVIEVRKSLQESIDASVDQSWDLYIGLTRQTIQYKWAMRPREIIRRVQRTVAGYTQARLAGYAVQHDYATNYNRDIAPPIP